MAIDYEVANRQRDRRLRRRLLNTLHLARAMSPRGGMSGRTLKDLVDGVMPPEQKFEDDGHALALMRDLANKDLFAEEALPRRRGQSFGLDYVFFRITAKGSGIWEETVPADPDIDDERLPENA
jgi:hypothetical protein